MSLRTAWRLAAALLLACTALGAAPVAHAYKRFCASADTFVFGDVPINTSLTGVATISSCGDEPWTFTGVSIHTATNPAYHVDSECVTGMTLGPGQGCKVSVTFAPLLAGQASGALWLHNTSTTPDQLLTFYGRGISAAAGTAQIAFSPPVVDFGTAEMGSDNGPLVVSLRNTGNATLVPTALVINGPAAYDYNTISYGAKGDCEVGRGVAPGASCTLNFTFRPLSEGSRPAQLVIDAAQLSSLVTLPLRGRGELAPVVVPPQPVDAIEFRRPASNQWFWTADPAQAAIIDAGGVGPGWERTGTTMHVWAADATGATNSVPVCRFFGAAGIGPASHFFSGNASECSGLLQDPNWVAEGTAFRALLPANGQCASGFDPVVRLLWRGAALPDLRHRYVVDPAQVTAMAAAGWLVEGPVFCSPH